MALLRPRAPWWIFLAAGAFLAYFLLLVYCDAVRPEHPGLQADFRGGRMLVTEVEAGSPAEVAGLRPGDVIRTRDGQPIVGRRDWVAAELNAEIGRAVQLGLERNGGSLDLWLPMPRVRWNGWTGAGITLAAARLIQAITLGFGLFLVFRRPGDLVATLGGWLLASAGVFSVVLPYRIAAVWRGLGPPGALLWFPHASSLVVSGLVLTFFLVFPVRRVRRAGTWTLVWAPIALAALGPLAHTWRAVYQPAHATGFADWSAPLVVVSLAYSVLAIVIPWRSYGSLADRTDRRRIRVLLIGTAIGGGSGIAVTVAYWYLSPYPELLASPLFIVLTLGLLAVPLAFTYAILRHRLFDVRIIVRQGLQYAAARGLLLSLVPVLAALAAVDLLIHWSLSVGAVLEARASVYLALGIAAFIAHRERDRWLAALDRRFFRERYDAARLLRQVADDLRDSGGLAAVADRVTAQIARALHPEYVALLLREQDAPDFRIVAASGAVDGLHVPPDGAMLELLRVLRKPVEVSLAEGTWLAAELPADEIASLRRSRLEMLVPVALERGRQQALLALGVKRSEEPFSGEDRELLAAIAAGLALLLAREAEHETVPVAPQAAASLTSTSAECAQCATCWPGDQHRCPHDGQSLTPIPLPLVFAGRYRLVRRLGRGGMGTVYEARDDALGRPVALKVLRDDRLSGSDAAARFRHEAQVAAAFAHPNVVTVHDFGMLGDNRGYLVMELVAGVTLREELKRRQSFDPEPALAILRGVVSAVDAAHARRIVHRDLKPDNIILASAGSGWLPKVLDFGIAKMLGADAGPAREFETAGGLLLGTLPYMAPEQLRGDEPSPASDTWALAVIACEMLTGRHPFAGEPLVGGSRAGGPVPVTAMLAGRPLLAPFFQRALALEPSARPSGASVLLAELETALETR